MDEVEFKIVLRKPKYPVMIVSAAGLFSAFNIKQLATGCLSSIPTEGTEFIQVVDSTGAEFWYSPDQFTLAPGFAFKKWTKKRIIEAFNNSPNAKSAGKEYPMKSLSNKRL